MIEERIIEIKCDPPGRFDGVRRWAREQWEIIKLAALFALAWTFLTFPFCSR